MPVPWGLSNPLSFWQETAENGGIYNLKQMKNLEKYKQKKMVDY